MAGDGKLEICKSLAPPRLSTVSPLKSAEYHHFHVRGDWLLFDVKRLSVLCSISSDKTILDLADDAPAGSSLVEIAKTLGLDEKVVAERVKVLLEHGLLLPWGDEPHAAQLVPPTGYATFMVNVSQRCNLTCPYCYVNKGLFDYETKPIAQMTPATADRIVERIHENFPNFERYGYHFYGGEPLMNFDAIRRIVAAAEAKTVSKGIQTDYHITTNGTLLTRAIADFLDEHRFTVYFSIDGDEAIHDEFRRYISGEGSFKDVDRNLAYLRTRPGVHLIGSSVVRKGLSLGEAIRFLEDHGARQCKAERVRLHDAEALAIKGEEHAAYLRDLHGLIDHYLDSLTNGRKPTDLRLSTKILQLLTKTRRNFFCPAGERMFGISADGEIYPCALHVGRPQSRLGDIFNGIDRAKQQAFRAKFSTESQKLCSTCWNRNLCGGGCSAMVDRFGHEDCQALMAESEAAISIFQHFANSDPVKLYGLVSPKIVRWIEGELEDPYELLPIEPAALKVGLVANPGRLSSHRADLDSVDQ